MYFMEVLDSESSESAYTSIGEFVKNSVFNVAFHGAKGIKAGSKIVGVNLRFDKASKKMYIDIFADCGIFRRKKKAPSIECVLEDETTTFEELKNGIVQYLFNKGVFENFLNNNFSFTVDSQPAINKGLR